MRHMAFPNTHPVGIAILTTVYRLNEGSDWSRHPRQLTFTTRLPVGRSGRLLCGGYLQARNCCGSAPWGLHVRRCHDAVRLLATYPRSETFPDRLLQGRPPKAKPRNTLLGHGPWHGQSRSPGKERLCDHTYPNKTFRGFFT
jgi:hypothetical protein